MRITAQDTGLARFFLCMLLIAQLILGPLLSAQTASASLLGDFTVKQEKELGEKYNTLMRARLPIIEDPEITRYIRGIVDDIAVHVPKLAFTLKTSVVLNHNINAFAAPAGYVYVFTGLITNFDHEAELAGVIAHELAHVSHRHLAARIKKQQITQLGMLAGMLAGMFMGMAAGGDNASEAGEAMIYGSFAAGTQTMLNYSRVDEREADRSGMQYLVAAGYNPKGMVSAFQKIKKKAWLAGAGNLPKYLSTHPAVEERITYLDRSIQKMDPAVQKRPMDDTKFRRIKALIMARFLDPQIALDAFSKDVQHEEQGLADMGRGIVYARENKISEAKAAFEKAVKKAPNDPLILREAGRFHYLKGDQDLAVKYLQKAVILNGDDLFALFYFARLLDDKGESKQAIQYFERILRTLPEDSEVHYYLGRTLGKSGQLFEGYTQLAYSAIYGLNKKKAKMHLKKVESLAKTDAQKEELKKLKELYKKRSEFW
ncbi:beta-barrel assembly-enhancing protease [Desulfobaculum bizertense]|uniref:Putative Zn-dependent protease, contains TPR repeats n=1 Tax=Desulfobaculum bizertense DSM 18034 TaxID=1121442 RepID=A0A1T4VTS4_9BACT|nr:M48 family metalloprotease [Desulfobaculum bizertense]SKA68392.1 Putative Zn-dependent protease, contains TPR repeats [Desulfobaculum bizertense DSM 18034]